MRQGSRGRARSSNSGPEPHASRAPGDRRAGLGEQQRGAAAPAAGQRGEQRRGAADALHQVGLGQWHGERAQGVPQQGGRGPGVPGGQPGDRQVVRFGVGSMIELNRTVDEPVELLVNNYPFARGEVVVVDGYYGVRVTEIGLQNDSSAPFLKIPADVQPGEATI